MTQAGATGLGFGHAIRRFAAQIVARAFRAFGVVRRSPLLFRLHLFGELALSVLFIAVLALVLGISLLLRPNRDEAQRTERSWGDEPGLVWTLAESDELTRQFGARANPGQKGAIAVQTAMWGPGPPAVDLSTVRGVDPRFNAITGELNQQYREMLANGVASAGTFSDENPPPQYRALEDLQPRDRAESIAYQKALVAFRAAAFERSANDLAGASCGDNIPQGPGGDRDAGARLRTWEIRCKWLQGRVDAAAGDGPAAARALREAIGAAEAARDEAGDSELISSLDPGNYMMDLPREGVAALWQDYLATLLSFDLPLCDRWCGEADAPWNVDGKTVALLTGHGSAKSYWRSYPELAVLTRLLLTREGKVGDARNIPVVLRDGNSTDSADGFQVRRFEADATEATLNPNYKPLAVLSEILVARRWPPEADDRDVTSLALIEFWKAHAASRERKLGRNAALEKPFDEGSAQRARFDEFQDRWRREWTGPWYPNDTLEYVTTVLLLLFIPWFLLVGMHAFYAEGRRRHDEWHAVMGSAYARTGSARAAV